MGFFRPRNYSDLVVKPPKVNADCGVSKATMAILACDEFCELDDNDARRAWMGTHGVADVTLNHHIVDYARTCLKRRKDNARLGLPDPLRGR